MEQMENRIRLVVVDSGINMEHPILKSCHINENSVAIHYKDGQIKYDKNIWDYFGHGTAVCGILHKLVHNLELTIIKIFDSPELQAEEVQLVEALDYIIDRIECDIVHMSLGLVTYSAALHEKCKLLNNKGVVLVAAYDNTGAISYPAVFKEVIGVDSDMRCAHKDDFFLIETQENNVTVLAKGGSHRLAWTDPLYIISQGSSFSAAYVSAYLAGLLSAGIRKEELIEQFKKNARKTRNLEVPDAPNLSDIPFEIHKAALYPYNKEMHSLINYAQNLNFDIQAVCDNKYSGRVGKKISSLDKRNSYMVIDIDHLNWNSIDTMIIGHLDELEFLTGKSLKKDLIQKCKANKINIYAFDDEDIDEELIFGFNAYTPKVESADYLEIYCGRLFKLRKPVIAVMGTSSKQGKFTLQLALRNAFVQQKYSVAEIGTEPSSLLFGLDGCFPFGHNSTVRLSDNELICSINKLMYDVENKRTDADIMIIGCQSGTVPMIFNNIKQMTNRQLSFLLGIMPDVVILCVNPDDEIAYIERTIKAIEGVADCRLLALALYPLAFLNGWQMMNSKKSKVANLNEIKEKFETDLNRDVYTIGDEADINRLTQLCIDYLAEE